VRLRCVMGTRDACQGIVLPSARDQVPDARQQLDAHGSAMAAEEGGDRDVGCSPGVLDH